MAVFKKKEEICNFQTSLSKIKTYPSHEFRVTLLLNCPLHCDTFPPNPIKG